MQMPQMCNDENRRLLSASVAGRKDLPPGGTGLFASCIAFAFLIGACGTAPVQPRPSPEVTHFDMEPVQITASKKDGKLSVDAYDAQELFERATTAYSEKRLDDAFANYKTLLDSFASSPQAKAAQYNLGLVYQDKLEWAKAATQFKSFIESHTESPDVKDAFFQMGVSLAEAKDWPASEQAFLAILDRKDLSADDRVEALTRRAVARFNLDDLDTAEFVLKEVFFFKRRLETTNEERLETDYFLALAQLMLGEISHKRSNAVVLRWPEDQMKKDLEAKAMQLLEARRRYIDAVRYGNPRIASMSAFQIGMLFQEFYDSVMAVPAPKELGSASQGESRDVYREELRLKLRIVLEKALRGHEHNIELFERLGVETEWVTKSRVAIERLRNLLYPEDIQKLPPSDPSSPNQQGPNLDNAAPSRRTPSETPPPVRQIL